MARGVVAPSGPLVLSLPYLPDLKAVGGNQRGFMWAQRHEAVKAERLSWRLLMDELAIKLPSWCPAGKARVTITAHYVPRPLPDWENLRMAYKPLMDELVARRILRDDSMRVLPEEPRLIVVPRSPRGPLTVVEIFPL